MIKQFKIFDIKTSVFTEDTVIEAKNSRKALEIYLKNKGENIQFRRSGDTTTRFKVREVGENKRSTWFKVTNN